MKGFVGDIEGLSESNDDFRRVLYAWLRYRGYPRRIA